MRYAIISDIHANLEALEACLRQIDTMRIRRIVCLGDIVGYNANPNECIDILRERGAMTIAGNHDLCAVSGVSPWDFSHHAAEAILWTRRQLTTENLEYLDNLPRILDVDGRFLAFHGWVNDSDRYILGAADALENFALMEEEGLKVGFFGHTHVAITYMNVGGSIVFSADDTIRIGKDVMCLANPGGLGQPRDKDPRASFIVYDTSKSTVAFHRVPYDIQATVDKIIGVGLPERLAERLRLGW